jgi:hypothetical protein
MRRASGNAFTVHGHHDRYFPVALVKFLPLEVLEEIVHIFSYQLRKEIKKALAAKHYQGKHSHTSSAQSEASVSSGSADIHDEDDIKDWDGLRLEVLDR